MEISELKKLLKAGEWNDAEFKKARNALPKSSFKTVSAFANTHGGWLVFGISQQGEAFDVSGVLKPDKVQNDFLSVLYDWGYVIDDGERRLPTRAAVILFGSLRSVRNLIPRPVIDVQFLGYATDEPLPETRWIDRFVSEENIVQSWLQLIANTSSSCPNHSGISTRLPLAGGMIRQVSGYSVKRR